jgi:hypothetical protein
MASFIYLLTTLFIGLKLVGSIAWSWWWILSPLWLGYPLYILLAFLLVWTEHTLNKVLE